MTPRVLLLTLALDDGGSVVALDGDGRLPTASLSDDELLNDAVRRIAADVAPGHHHTWEKGQPWPVGLEQFAATGDGSQITVAYTLLLPNLELLSEHLRWSPVLPSGEAADLSDQDLAVFLHGMEHLATEAIYSPRLFDLLPELFIIDDVHRVYEIIWRTKLNRQRFRRNFYGLKAFEYTDKTSKDGRGITTPLCRKGSPHRFKTPIIRP